MSTSPKTREEFIDGHKQRIYEVCAGKVLQDEKASEIASYVYSKGRKNSEQRERFNSLYEKALFESFCLICLGGKEKEKKASVRSCEEFIENYRQHIYEVCAGKVLQDEKAGEIASYVYSNGTKNSEQREKFDCLYYESLNDYATEQGIEKEVRKSWLFSQGMELLNNEVV